MKPKRYAASEILKFSFLDGRYVCRCGSTIVVSAKILGLGVNKGVCLLREGYYDIDDLDPKLIPDCLLTDEERGQ